MRGKLKNHSPEKEKPKCQPRGARSLTAVKLMAGVLTLVLKRQGLGRKKSVAIHAETHGRDGVSLSAQTSIDFCTSTSTSDVVIHPSQTLETLQKHTGADVWWCVCIDLLISSLYNALSFCKSVLALLVQHSTKQRASRIPSSQCYILSAMCFIASRCGWILHSGALNTGQWCINGTKSFWVANIGAVICLLHSIHTKWLLWNPEDFASLPLTLLFSIFQPNLWCEDLCGISMDLNNVSLVA